MSFADVLPRVLADEGIYSKDPHDAGGETVFGIDRRDNPAWGGWAEVNRLLVANTPTTDWSQDTALMAQVRAFYLALWTKHSLDSVPRALQSLLFNGIVNQGDSVVADLQVALGQAGYLVDVDGGIGPQTLEALGKAPVVAVTNAFWRLRAERYLNTVGYHPEDAVFFLGWLKRLQADA